MKHGPSGGALRMRVAAWQSRLPGYDPQTHADVMGRCTDEAVDLLVLPECYFGGMPKRTTMPALRRSPRRTCRWSTRLPAAIRPR